jgi:Fe-S oxidoreductase
VIRDGWRSEEVKRSLDLCLACKGCKSECPVGVDLASYKAEFLSHYYEGRLRPRSAYAFGNIDLWARLASHVPGLANLATQLPGLRDIAKLVAGIPRQRAIPAFAPQTFKSWFHSRRPESGRREGAQGSPVLLWPDTFNNYFRPETAKAAVNVLEAAGFRVIVPRANLCCGRPLYDYGMLDRAGTLLLQIIDELTPEIEAGTPIIGLEPSCVAVFRDELVNLFPQNERAQALSRQTFLLSEFLENHARHVPLPNLNRKAILHGHCHQKSLMKMTTEESVLSRLGIAVQSPAPGCCGMAGSFGFERENYDISMAIGELELLPAVRQAPLDWLIIADGFSCREQIAQGTNRRALHLAEVLQMALKQHPEEPHDYPETPGVRRRDAEIIQSMRRAGVGLAALAAAGVLLFKLHGNR